MEKYINKLLIILAVIFMIPVFVMAEPIESDLYSLDNVNIEYEFGGIKFSHVGFTKYIRYSQETGEAGVFFGYAHNDYVKDVDLQITLIVYDKDMNVLDSINQTFSIKAKSYARYEQIIFQKDVLYSLKDVYYYRLSSDVLTDIDIITDPNKDDYYFENYNLRVEVNEDHIANVTRTFDAVFKRHVDTVVVGIPFRLRYTTENGKKINKRVVMSDIIVPDDVYDLKTEEGNRNVYIGAEDKELNKKGYNLNYNYNFGKDSFKDKDEFVFYIINEEVRVDGVSFEIVMPKEFLEDKVSFIDKHGTVVENIEYEVDGNTIRGRIKGVVNPGVQYAVKVILKDGYFIKPSRNISSLMINAYIIPIIFAVVTMLIWFLVKEQDDSTKYESIYFNKNINSLEMGYLYKGYIKENDVATILLSLANKGFVDIEKTKKGYKIIKKKEYDGDDGIEKVFMKDFFCDKKEVTRKDLMACVTDLMPSVDRRLDKHRKNTRLFIHPIFNYKLLFWLLIVGIIIVETFNILIEYQASAIPLNLILGGIGYLLLLVSITSKGKKIEKAIYTVLALILITVPIILTSYKAFLEDNLKLVAYIIGLLSMLLIAGVISLMDNRSGYGKKIHNAINGYKNYLSNLTVDDVYKELKKNKRCIYEVLPYTFVLGISDKWIKLFKKLDIVKPSWYKVDNFDLEEFYSDIKDVYSDIYIALKNTSK